MQLSPAQWTTGLAGLALLIQGARGGYRHGPVRQLAGPIALLASALIGWLAGPPVGLILFADSMVPWMLREGAGMLAVGSLTWLVALAWLWRLGRRPKDAEEAESPVLGAMVGCWTGLLNAALLLLALTAWAGLAETTMRPEEARRHWAVEFREDLARLQGAGSLSGFSPWPERWGRILRKTREVLAEPEASRNLMEQEPVRALAAHPSFYTAWGDPGIKLLLRQGRFLEAAQHPKARALLNDEAFQRQLLKLDMENILDKALAIKNPR